MSVSPSWEPPGLIGAPEETLSRRPVLDDLPPWMPGGLVAAEFAAGAVWPNCQCPRCVPQGALASEVGTGDGVSAAAPVPDPT